MSIPPDLPGSRPASFRYPVEDPETHGLYEVVSTAPLTREQIDRVVAAVIEDEGRIQSGRKRVILID